MTPRARAVRAAAIAAALGGSVACGGSAPSAAGPGPAAPGVGVGEPVDFSFESLDERPVSAEAMRGEPGVIVFATTSNLAAQAQIDFLIAMSKHDGDRVHYAAVVLALREERELVELYRQALGIPFPVALADPRGAPGAEAFGDVSAVPVTVLLDRSGRIVWRLDGRVARSEELRAAMRGL